MEDECGLGVFFRHDVIGHACVTIDVCHTDAMVLDVSPPKRSLIEKSISNVARDREKFARKHGRTRRGTLFVTTSHLFPTLFAKTTMVACWAMTPRMAIIIGISWAGWKNSSS